MHSPPPKKARGTYQLLESVAPNLYRHKKTGVYYGMKKVEGKRQSRALGTGDRKTADRKLAEWLRDLEGVDPGNRDVTLSMLLDRFTAARAGKGASTITSEAGMMKEFRATFPRPMASPVVRTRHSDIAAWLAEIEPGKRASTYNRWRLFVRQLFALAEADGIVAKSPFLDKLNKPAKKNKIHRLIPTAEEFLAICNAIRRPVERSQTGRRGGQRAHWQHESADFAEFLGLAGVGQAEAVALTWGDINEERDEIQYLRKKTGRHFKTPVFPWLRPLLAAIRHRAGGDPSGTVFKIKNVKHALDNACKRLGLPHFTQRSLRAMRIKRLWEAGVDVKVIAEWQGHSDGGKLIMDTYTEVFGTNDDSYKREQLAKATAAAMPPLPATA